SMQMLVAGRLVQGLGGGAMTVALYVVIARVYPARLHAQVFAAFSAAWVIPSMIGPFAAGVVAELSSWHWVFLGVVGLVVPALAMILPAMRGVRPLVPRGTLGAHRGLPSVILMRGVASAAFFGTEVYVPYLLTERYS